MIPSSVEVFKEPNLDFEISFDRYFQMDVSYLGFILLVKFRLLEFNCLIHTEVWEHISFIKGRWAFRIH
jgi:hypothetical protein